MACDLPPAIPDIKGLARAVPGLPLGTDGPVFRAPWEAQAFAMVVSLHEKGIFTWAEWAGALSHAIGAAQAEGDPDTGETYYEHWLRALETMVDAKSLLNAEGLLSRREEWRSAALHTPHGLPVTLDAAERAKHVR